MDSRDVPLSLYGWRPSRIWPKKKVKGVKNWTLWFSRYLIPNDAISTPNSIWANKSRQITSQPPLMFPSGPSLINLPASLPLNFGSATTFFPGCGIKKQPIWSKCLVKSVHILWSSVGWSCVICCKIGMMLLVTPCLLTRIREFIHT